MFHKISDMCDKCKVIYDKAQLLKKLKYDTKTKNRELEIEIDNLIVDIQSLCRDIANDTGKYKK
jgi:hypothetical protein